MPRRGKTKRAQKTAKEPTNSSPEQQQPTSYSTSYGYSWPPIDRIPTETPQVVLAFHGLMGFAYNKSRRSCEVGMHSQAVTHKFEIEVYDHIPNDQYDKPFYTYDGGSLAGHEPPSIELEVEGAKREYRPPRFYMNKYSDDDEHDFRRVVDFENNSLYDRRLKLNTPVFKPQLRVKTGVFLTALTTQYPFYCLTSTDTVYLGHLAEITAAAIFHEAAGYVSLRIGQHYLKLAPQADRIYLVFFKNLCPQDNSARAVTRQQTRNDFHLYYETFEIPEDEEEYEFFNDGRLPPSLLQTGRFRRPQQRDRRIPEWLQDLRDVFKRSSRETPCGESGFGKTDRGLSGG